MNARSFLSVFPVKCWTREAGRMLLYARDQPPTVHSLETMRKVWFAAPCSWSFHTQRSLENVFMHMADNDDINKKNHSAPRRTV